MGLLPMNNSFDRDGRIEIAQGKLGKRYWGSLFSVETQLTARIPSTRLVRSLSRLSAGFQAPPGSGRTGLGMLTKRLHRQSTTRIPGSGSV